MNILSIYFMKDFNNVYIIKILPQLYLVQTLYNILNIYRNMVITITPTISSTHSRSYKTQLQQLFIFLCFKCTYSKCSFHSFLICLVYLICWCGLCIFISLYGYNVTKLYFIKRE